MVTVALVPSQAAFLSPKVGMRQFPPPTKEDRRRMSQVRYWPCMPWGFTYVATLCTGACRHDTIYYCFSFPVKQNQNSHFQTKFLSSWWLQHLNLIVSLFLLIARAEMIPKSKHMHSSFHTLMLMYICKHLFRYLVLLKDAVGISNIEQQLSLTKEANTSPKNLIGVGVM